MVFWILPKNERWDNFQYIKLSQHSFFGRIQDAVICFRDLLTFRGPLFSKPVSWLGLFLPFFTARWLQFEQATLKIDTQLLRLKNGFRFKELGKNYFYVFETLTLWWVYSIGLSLGQYSKFIFDSSSEAIKHALADNGILLPKLS